MKGQTVVFIILGLILVLAAGLRLYHLASIPPGPGLDEVSNGYNAYALLKTGRDEYGRHMPLLLQAYNDFRPAFFVYFTIPFIQMFGLTVFAIRLPSVVLAVLTTLSLFFLTSGLYRHESDKEKRYDSFGSGFDFITVSSLSASFFYAISPWNMYSSRFSNEVNMSLSFFVFALTFFVFALKKSVHRKVGWGLFLLSVICFVISFYSYHGIKLFLPFFIAGLIIIFFRDLFIRKKMLFIGVAVGIIMLIPLFIAFSNPATRVRLGAVDLLHQNPHLVSSSADRILYDTAHNDRLGMVFDNRRVLLFYQFMQNYLRNFDPTWLFLMQDNKSFSIPDFGPFYLFELPLFLLGIYVFITTDRISKQIKWMLLVWICASIMPSALSGESPHLNRTNTIVPAFLVLMGIGLTYLLCKINTVKNFWGKSAGYGGVLVIIVFSFLSFLHAYFVNLPYMYSKSFQYGVVDAFIYAKDHEKDVTRIIVANDNNLLEGYMYYLFANRYDPAEYQKSGGTQSGFFTDDHVIGRYNFLDFNLIKPGDAVRTLHTGDVVMYITNPSELSPEVIGLQHLQLVKTITFLDGSNAIVIWEGRL